MFLEIFRMRLGREIRTPGAWGGAQWMLVWRVVGYSPHGFLHAHLYGLATRADVRKSLGVLLANGPGGARLLIFGCIYIYMYIYIHIYSGPSVKD